jgi:hypothetical protein
VSLGLFLLRACLALWKSSRDLFPIVLTIGFFQLFVFQRSLDNLLSLLIGLVLIVFGLTLFIVGLNIGLFPLGEQMARDFASRGSLPWLIAFAFSLGFGTTFAEPALIAVASKAADQAIVEAVEGNDLAEMRRSYSLLLRTTVAVAVGSALVLGVIRIILGWSLHYWMIAGYALVIVLTPFAPSGIVGVAYDSGGVTTSTITVPLTTALGVGLASSIQGRSPLLDGFGMIALASLAPILFVLLLGILWT